MGWILGIDPGTDGGFCELHDDLSIKTWRNPKSEADRVRLITGITSKEGCEGVFLEFVHGRLGNSMKSVTTFMKGTGFLKGSVLTAFDIQRGGFPLFREVAPKKWQDDLGAPKAPKEPKGKKKAHIRKRIHKNNLKDFASEIFPDHKFTLYTCDAALIAWWGAHELWDIK